MSKYLKLFNNHAEYTAFLQSEDFIKPNVSHCIAENDVHYNPIETRLVVKYTVTDATQSTRLYSYEDYEWELGTDRFDKVEIDGVEVSISDLDTAEGNYQLSAGEHTVKYTLKDPTSIGNGAFSWCRNITSVTIPNSVTNIGKSAFQECGNLTNITIQNNVTNIGEYAFAKCSSLTSVNIPNSVTSIGNGAFESCYSLSDVTIDTTEVDSWFSGLPIENVTLGENVQTVSDGAFCGCEYINQDDAETIEGYNEHAFCETYCILAKFDDNTEKALLGNGRACSYTLYDGDEYTLIPNDKIINEIID